MKIENYRQQPKNDKLEAIFDVYLDKIQLTFRNLKLARGKNGKFYIQYPSFPMEDGPEKRWLKIFEFSTERQKDFETQVWEGLKGYIPNFSQSV